MADQPSPPAVRPLSRRQALRLIGGVSAAAALGACTPAAVLLRTYPDRYRTATHPTELALAAFVTTVVPGADAPMQAAAVAVLQDPFYPLAEHSAALASDLDRRARRAEGKSFSSLSPAQRTAVVRQALEGDVIARKLYTGAAFLTQVAVYGGIHDDRAGSPLIDFPGGYHLEPPQPFPAGIAVPHHPRTADGNPA